MPHMHVERHYVHILFLTLTLPLPPETWTHLLDIFLFCFFINMLEKCNTDQINSPLISLCLKIWGQGLTQRGLNCTISLVTNVNVYLHCFKNGLCIVHVVECCKSNSFILMKLFSQIWSFCEISPDQAYSLLTCVRVFVYCTIRNLMEYIITSSCYQKGFLFVLRFVLHNWQETSLKFTINTYCFYIFFLQLADILCNIFPPCRKFEPFTALNEDHIINCIYHAYLSFSFYHVWLYWIILFHGLAIYTGILSGIQTGCLWVPLELFKTFISEFVIVLAYVFYIETFE